MARWNRSGRYYGRNRYGYGYGRRTYYNRYNQTKRSYGNIRAAKQQADQSTVVINIPSKLDNVFSQRQNISGVEDSFGVAPINIYDLLRKSEFYLNYANMYDEFKIENIKVKLLPTSWTRTTGDNSTYSNLTVYTAWDRSGLNDSQLKLITAGTYNNDPISATDTRTNYQVIGKNGDQDGLYCVIGEDITTYSSAESRQVNPNTQSTITRWLKPKTINEKSQWLSTSSIRKWYDSYSDGGFVGIPTYNTTSLGEPIAVFNLPTSSNSSSVGILKSSSAVQGNPAFLLEDPSISFKPTLLVGLYPIQDSTAAVPDIINFNVETEVVVAFRGLRKAKVVS